MIILIFNALRNGNRFIITVYTHQIRCLIVLSVVIGNSKNLIVNDKSVLV